MDKQAQYAEAASLFEQMKAAGVPEPEARSLYDAAVARIAALPDQPTTPAAPVAAPQSPQNVPGNTQGAPSVLRAAGGLIGAARGDFSGLSTAAQSPTVRGALGTAVDGATYGFGDELVGIGNPAAKEAMRTDVANFARENPLASFALNTAGGIATGGGLASLGKAGIPLASRAAGLIGKSAIAQGALAGAGSAEGGAQDRLMPALTGGVVGGAMGAVAGKVAGKAAQALARRREGATMPTMAGRRALSSLAQRVDDSEVGIDGLIEAGAKNTAQGAAIVDNLGVPGERMLRGIRVVGGKPAETIDNVMNARLRQYPERIVDALYNGQSIENVVQTTDDLVAQRAEAARPLYKQFRAQPSAFIPEVDALLQRPLFKKAVALAEDFQANTGVTPPKIALPNGKTRPLHSPEFLDNVKKALDDIIYKGRQPGEGGMGPGAMAQAKQLRSEFVERLDKAFPDYKAARDVWAGPTALKEAMEDGIEAAGGGGTPEMLQKTLSTMGESEREMFRRGFVDQLRQQVEKGGIKPAKTEQRDLIKRIDAVFGDDANMILTRLRDEVAANRTATTITKGSQTADKQADVMGELNPAGQHLSRLFFLPQRFKADVLDNLLSAATNPFDRATRQELTSLLLSPADNADILKKLAAEVGAQRTATRTAARTKPAGAAFIETGAGFFRAPRDERENRR